MRYFSNSNKFNLLFNEFLGTEQMSATFEQLHSLQLGRQWPGMGSVCSDRDYSFEPTTALCGGKPGI